MMPHLCLISMIQESQVAHKDGAKMMAKNHSARNINC